MAIIVCAVAVADAQDTAPVQVFVTRSEEGNTVGQDTVSLVNTLTGEVTEAAVYGENYTVVGREVLFYDRLNDEVGLIAPDGEVRPHPFIQPEPTTRRVDWVVSRDHRLLAWTLTESAGGDMLTTTTHVADINSEERRQVLTDGPRAGIRAQPVAFSADGNYLYMDYQPDTLGAFTPYDEYAGLFEVSLKDGETDYLPDEPGCYCGAGFGGGYFVRLSLADDLSGFNLRAYDLAAQVTRTAEALPLQNYTQGGDVLVSPDGTRAIYALAQVRDFGSPAQTVRTVFVVVNLDTMTQRQLTQPQTLYIRPVAWTEGNEAVIFTSPTRAGTWKMDIESGRLTQIAAARYIGTMPGNANTG
jgi:hypothetical protein